MNTTEILRGIMTVIVLLLAAFLAWGEMYLAAVFFAAFSIGIIES